MKKVITSVNLEGNIYKWLEKNAHTESRSISGQVNHILKQVKAKEEK